VYLLHTGWIFAALVAACQGKTVNIIVHSVSNDSGLLGKFGGEFCESLDFNVVLSRKKL